jgi:hypothetical protein
MSLINKTISQLVSGMSQQADELRYPGQAQEVVNARLDIATGVSKRPGSEHTSRITGLTADELKNAAVHIYSRDSDEQYLVVATSGGLQVFDESGTPKSVVYGATSATDTATADEVTKAKEYLLCSSPQASLRFTTIADYTFVLNRAKRVKASVGTDTRTLRPDTAYLYVAFASKDLSYKVTIDSVHAPTSAESNDTSGTAGRISSQINVSMAGRFEAKHMNNSSVIRIRSLDGSALPKIIATDGYADQALFVIQNEVARFSDLPPLCDEGFVVSVTGDPDTTNDQYWVEYKDGRWQECLKPELNDNAFDVHSMPHVLVRQADGNFYFHPAAWAERLVGDKESNPAPTFVGRKINDVFYFRNRLGFLSDENVILSRAGKPFMFWRESATMLLDSDPIDISVSSTRVSTLYHAVPFNKELVLFSDQGQFIMTAQQTLTPKSASITEATGFAASKFCKPQQFGPNLVFPVEREDFAALREYYTSSDSALNNAVDLTAHVPALIPKGVSKISTSTHEDLLVTMTEATPSKLFVYKSFWNGQEKVQSAWSYWDFGVGTQINGFEFIGSRLYVVLTRTDGAFIERIDMSQQDVDGTLPFKVALDRRHLAVGAYSAALDETAFEVPYLDDALVGVVVALPAVTQEATTGARNLGLKKPVVGGVVPSASRIEKFEDKTRVWVKGDWAGVQAIFGIPFVFTFKFGRLFLKDANERIVSTEVKIRRMALKFSRAGLFKVVVTPYGRPTYEYPFSLTLANGSAASVFSKDEYYRQGEFSSQTAFWFPVMSRSDAVDITIINDSYIPASFYGAEWEGVYVSKSRRF